MEKKISMGIFEWKKKLVWEFLNGKKLGERKYTKSKILLLFFHSKKIFAENFLNGEKKITLGKQKLVWEFLNEKKKC
jgi:hypothetical protein